WLDHLTKYVRTVGRRGAKLRGMRGAVADAQFDLRDAWRRYAKLAQAAQQAPRPVAAVDALRWGIEE
ncbi:MAG: hypothetical protein ACK53C_07840, partial [Pseudomonadota bacterium]